MLPDRAMGTRVGGGPRIQPQIPVKLHTGAVMGVARPLTPTFVSTMQGTLVARRVSQASGATVPMVAPDPQASPSARLLPGNVFHRVPVLGAGFKVVNCPAAEASPSARRLGLGVSAQSPGPGMDGFASVQMQDAILSPSARRLVRPARGGDPRTPMSPDVATFACMACPDAMMSPSARRLNGTTGASTSIGAFPFGPFRS
mmetsp:Transcript_131887/g.422292  ORF Transcript_131887/g.422292 Transcript_131887/m.422292 type:complete len:201 (+) Transcript_131887:102-704(+)